MHKSARVLVAILLAMASRVHGAESPGPVFVYFADDVGNKTASIVNQNTVGLAYHAVAAIAQGSINKKSRGLVQALHARLGAFDLSKAALAGLACVSVAEPETGCRDSLQLEVKPGTVEEALTASGADRALLVEITPEWRPEQLLIRAVARDVVRKGNEVSLPRAFTALYSVRVPEQILKDGKKKPALIEEFWSQGAPNRLETELQNGFVELARMLTELARDTGPQGELPASWASAPDVTALEDAGKASCGGMGCNKGHRIVREEHGRRWIAYLNGTAPLLMPPHLGPVMASFDDETVKFQLHLWIYTTTGVGGFR
jgi:hypothetical protein